MAVGISWQQQSVWSQDLGWQNWCVQFANFVICRFFFFCGQSHPQFWNLSPLVNIRWVNSASAFGIYVEFPRLQSERSIYSRNSERSLEGGSGCLTSTQRLELQKFIGAKLLTAASRHHPPTPSFQRRSVLGLRGRCWPHVSMLSHLEPSLDLG